MIAAIKERLQKSLVLMGEIGGNDFNGPFYRGRSIHEVCKLIPGVVKTIKDAVEVSQKSTSFISYYFKRKNSIYYKK